MTAPAQTTVHRRLPAPDDARTRIPWWGLALPAAAFAVLLMLMLAGGGTAAAHSARPVTGILAQIARVLPG